MKKLFIILSLCGLTSMVFATSSPAPDDKTTVVVTTTADCSTGSPCFVIKTSANTLSQAVNQNLSNQQAFTMVQNSIIPQIDFTLMTRLAMGNNWKAATPEQQDQITNQFKQMLVYSYSRALSKLKGAEVTINSSKTISEKKAIVTCTLALPSNGNSNNQPINIEYDLAKIGTAWKIYDVKIENASIVTTYRSQFNDTIQKDGVSGLISQLQTKADALKTTK